MKILVTGATGFVGSHLCELLLKENHEVIGLVRSIKKLNDLNLKIPYIYGSLNDLSWLPQLPEDLDVVVHTAGIVHAHAPETFHQENFSATKHFIDKLAKKYPKLKFIFISSLAAAGPALQGQLVTEDHPASPISEYGKSKFFAEQYLMQHAPQSWDKIVLRPPMIIGPRDIAILDIVKMVSSGSILLPGLGSKNKKYSFISVFDLNRAIQKLIEKTYLEKSERTYFISHPSVVTFDQIIQSIKVELGKKSITYVHVPSLLIKLTARLLKSGRFLFKHDLRLTTDKSKELLAPAWICSGDKIQNEIEFNYHDDFSTTLKMTLEDYKNRRWI